MGESAFTGAGMVNRLRRQARGFSLVELVIVITILGILAAIALARASRGTEGAAGAALADDLAVMRKALDVYQAEHDGVFPQDPASQLTGFTDDFGNVSPTQDSTHDYGPYLRRIPPLPVGAARGAAGIAAGSGPGVGWIYDGTSGNISANTTTEADATGKLYNTY